MPPSFFLFFKYIAFESKHVSFLSCSCGALPTEEKFMEISIARGLSVGILHESILILIFVRLGSIPLYLARGLLHQKPSFFIAQSPNGHGLHTFTSHSGYHLCVGHTFFTFVAKSPYEQAGPETSVVIYEGKSVGVFRDRRKCLCVSGKVVL